ALNFLYQAQRSLGLSVRAVDSTLRTARTIAQLDGACQVGEEQVAEALQYRWETHEHLLA
ncbi:MAG TPA: hypothetical protein DCQ17_05165, partial [Firmicutes bacterium]|nr:hypothetical protein [Bacillota bacterium]